MGKKKKNQKREGEKERKKKEKREEKEKKSIVITRIIMVRAGEGWVARWVVLRMVRVQIREDGRRKGIEKGAKGKRGNGEGEKFECGFEKKKKKKDRRG